ncbi:jg19049 [Pararge aegeria aegeria]|uniref:Jg19049 protein n=1 Tax=Pararge aegeria aegeria TaxID=348720 RepID=A0A8S4R0H7_9NEOP|nr:jg19049 [Pararge aegeria aegeria]
MVRHYKRIKEKSYSERQLEQAVDAVKENKMTLSQAAKLFAIPRTTIYFRLNHCVMTRAGHPTVFSPEFEKRMADCLYTMEKCGFPLTRKEASVLISEYVRQNGLVTLFKNQIPGKDWFHSFQKRNELSIKKPQNVELARKNACDPFIIYGYLDLMESVLQELELKEKPKQIYNLDETSICNDPTKGKIIGKKGFKATKTTSGPGRNNTTVLLATNACGDKIPPLIIFQGKFLWNQWFYAEEQVKTAYAVSDKGWMETSIFEKYMRNVFVPAIGPERPVLLIFDGHKTHVTLGVIEYAASQGITIIKLPPHTSHVLQPLDLSTMKSLKDRWEAELIGRDVILGHDYLKGNFHEFSPKYGVR